MDIIRDRKEKEDIINRALRGYIKEGNALFGGISRLMNYSLLGKGKRIRPMLMLIAAEALGKDWRKFLNAACGVEMIHVSSLILDDLPCMDNALTRRGKLALHRVDGEANAILASYALLVQGVKLICQDAAALKVDTQHFGQIISSIADSIGLKGISLGQFLDLKFRNKKHSVCDIRQIHSHKTASLFAASLEITAILAGADKKQIDCLKEYGRNLGLAFQIKDDLLGYEKKPAQLGKQSLKGEISPNYARLEGKKRAETAIKVLTKKACLNLRILGKKARNLKLFANFIEEREK